jgi:LuxR family transcriptional regulator, transcriptional regulator of spore coat protein
MLSKIQMLGRCYNVAQLSIIANRGNMMEQLAIRHIRNAPRTLNWVATQFAISFRVWPKGRLTVLHIDPLSGVPALTAREQQVLELVAQGLSAKEAAQEIEIAPRTVERHIENVRLKIRARNRTHMVTLALELGLLHIDGAFYQAKVA